MKLYVDEPGHEPIRGLSAIVLSDLARVEVPAALWRKHRAGELSAQGAAVLTTAFASDITDEDGGAPRYAAVPITRSILDQAVGLVAAQALRAYDAVALATALAVRQADPACDTFACFDESLREAAAANGFRLFP